MRNVTKARDNIAIKLTGVSKKYYIHHYKPTLAERLLKGGDEEFWALKNINLVIKKGEKVGIIGPNGSGKTTLLKLITGIATPTKGAVKTFGKVVSLIDLEAGFHSDLTGLQNIYLNGVTVGMRKEEIQANMDKIVEFASIGRFIDSQLFTYSEGMKLRLGFSVAVHTDPDILILDENISVGDQDFKEKSFMKIKDLLRRNKTIILASHNMDVIKDNTERTIWLQSGKILRDGRSRKVVSDYVR